MDSVQGKLFIGGISVETTEERVKDYFSMFGEVREAEIKKDRLTGRARGFGFLVFADPAVADRVLLQSKHTIDGQMVEVKKAISRDEQHSISITRSRTNTVGRSQIRTKKIFVGGLAPTVTENDLRKYFEHFGTIIDLVVMYDSRSQRPRGFGFVVYDSEDVVDRVLQRPFHQLNGKTVEVKRSIPKAFNPVGRGRNFGFNNGQGFSSIPVPPMNAPQGGGGGYSSYGPPTPISGGSSYGGNAPSYGTSSGISYEGAPAPVIYGGPVAYRGAPAPVSYGGPVAYGGAPAPVSYEASVAYGGAPAPVIYEGSPATVRYEGSVTYGGAPAPAPVSYGGPVAYGAGNSGNGGPVTNNATPAGSNMWATTAPAPAPAPAPVRYGGPVSYGAGNSGNGGPVTNNATPAGSNMWATPAMAYGNTGSSVQYGSGGITPPAQVQNGQSNGSRAGCTM